MSFQHFQFKVFPFGLKSAPQTFSKCMAVVAAFLRKQRIFIYPYLDDWLLKSSSPALLQTHLSYYLQLLNRLGLYVNYKKSIFNPTQDPLPGCLPGYRKSKHVSFGGEVILNPRKMSPTASHVTSHSQTGVITAGINGIMHLHSAKRQIKHVPFATMSGGPVDADIGVLGGSGGSPLIGQGFHQMVDEALPSDEGSSFSPGPSYPGDSHGCFTPRMGCSYPLQVQGLWSEVERGCHINLLELRAVHLALKSLYLLFQSQSLLIQTDNTTTMYYLNKQGGTRSRPLSLEGQTIWKWLLTRDLTIVTIHLPGTLNV